MDKCRNCEHWGRGDLDKCMQCLGVAPLRVRVGLLLAVLLLFFMAVLASAEALQLKESREGMLTMLIRQQAAAAPAAAPVPAARPDAE